MIKEAYRTYCAGLFEGEGNIRYYEHTTRTGNVKRSIRISIGMTDIYPLQLFYDIMEVGTLRENAQFGLKSTKPIHIYSASRFEHVQFIVCNIWDWLSPRRKEQIKTSITAYTSWKGKRTPYSLSRNEGGGD